MREMDKTLGVLCDVGLFAPYDRDVQLQRFYKGNGREAVLGQDNLRHHKPAGDVGTDEALDGQQLI